MSFSYFCLQLVRMGVSYPVETANGVYFTYQKQDWRLLREGEKDVLQSYAYVDGKVVFNDPRTEVPAGDWRGALAVIVAQTPIAEPRAPGGRRPRP